MSVNLLLRDFDRATDAPDAMLRLRRFVLDLAVRGKLTERSSDDEPASNLLSRIQCQLDVTISRSSRRKSVRFEPITASEAPFSVPEGWIWTRVRQITRDRGQTVPTSAFTYIDVTAIDKELGRLGAPVIMSATEAPSRARKIVSRGDVLYSCVRPYLLNIAVIEHDLNPLPIASTAFAVLDGAGLVEPRYLWTVLRSPYFVECVEDKMRGLAYPAINDSDFSQLPVPLPPLAEQRRIVGKVEELMTLCDQLESAQTERELQRDALRSVSLYRLTATDEDVGTAAGVRFFLDTSPRLITKPNHVAPIRQTILDLAVRGRLVPQDPGDEPAAELLLRLRSSANGSVAGNPKSQSEPFHLPTGWEWVRFPELGEFGRGKSKHRPRNDPVLYAGGLHPFIQTGDVARSGGLIRTFSTLYNDTGLAQSQMWPAGTLCITIAANIADSGVLTFDACFPDSVVGLIVSSEFTNCRYFEYFLRTAKADLHSFAPSTAQKNINLSILRDVMIPLPPLKELNRIVTRVDELMAVCDELEAALESAQAERGRLLEALLYGALEESSSTEASIEEVV